MGANGSPAKTTSRPAEPAIGQGKVSFVERANALCAEFNEGVGAGLATTPTDGSHIYEAFLFQLQTITSQPKRWQALFADGFRVSDGYEELEEAVADGKGSSAVAKAKAEIDRAKSKFSKTALAEGLQACVGGDAFTPGKAIPKFG